MKHSSALADLDLSEKCRTYALAYLDGAEAFTERLLQEERHSYAHGSVAIGLARHSVELMLKAVLLKMNRFPQKAGHSLEALAQAYRETFPNLPWNVPFRTQVLGADSDAAADAVRKEHDKDFPNDQLHRYPMNRDLIPWEMAGAFDASSFADLLRSIRSDFERITSQVWPVIAQHGAQPGVPETAGRSG